MGENTGNTAVRDAIRHGDVAALQHLVHGDPSRANAVVRWGENDSLQSHPLHFVCDMFWEGTFAPGTELALVDVLLASGADVNARNGAPLNAAASLGAEDVGLRLLAAGADPRSTGLLGETALHWAANLGAVRLVAGLIAAGAPLDQEDREHSATPIQWAFHGWDEPPPPPWQRVGRRGSHQEAVARLVAAGAHVPREWLEAEPVRSDPEKLAALHGQIA